MPTWLANVTSPRLGLVSFGLAWQLVAAHCEHAKPSHWFTGTAYSQVPMPACVSVCMSVCVRPYTCSCRTLTSRNSRKFNHAQLTRADRRLLQSLLTLSPSSCQGAATRARVGSDFFRPASRLDNHVEYLALMSPHSTSISLLV